MNPSLTIRAAGAADAVFAADMVYLSMEHLADHLFDMKKTAVTAMLVKLFARRSGRFGHGSALIAEFENEPVGLLVAERGDKVNRLNLETIPHLVAVLGLVRTIAFIRRSVTLPGGKEAEDDEFFVSNLSILPSMQGRSFGSQLLAHAETLAHENNLMKCSLIVGSYNTSARRLYERTGYQIVETVPDENENLGYYRMVKAL